MGGEGGRHGERGWEGGGEGREISPPRSFPKVGAYDRIGMKFGTINGLDRVGFLL